MYFSACMGVVSELSMKYEIQHSSVLSHLPFACIQAVRKMLDIHVCASICIVFPKNGPGIF